MLLASDVESVGYGNDVLKLPTMPQCAVLRLRPTGCGIPVTSCAGIPTRQGWR